MMFLWVERFLRKIPPKITQAKPCHGRSVTVMNVQEVKKLMRIREWAEQIRAREHSGLTIKAWCAKQGIDKKTYYYRMKRVREALLEGLNPETALQLIR
jgi:hypothetical protein